METIDLLKYKNTKFYDGNTKKIGVTIDNINYIAKFCKNKNDMSTVSEHVASTFIRGMGYSAHQTKLVLSKGETVVLMKDFTTPECTLRSFKDIIQANEDTDLSEKNYSYDDVLYLINKHTKMNNELKQKAIEHFWIMFVFDTILANRDRHQGNWGFLTKPQGYVPAPLYDNSSCLFPDANCIIENYISNRYVFLKDRSEKYPASLLLQYSKQDKRYKRTNYNGIIQSKVYADLELVVEKFRKLDFQFVKTAIEKAVDNKLIPEVYQKFYIDILCMRYLHIIKGLTIENSFKILERGEK